MEYVRTTCGKGKPDEADVTKMSYAAGSALPNPHGHHVVMKGDRFPENAQARNILCKHGINPYVGCENLVYSRNWCHSAAYAKKVLELLEEADEKGGLTAVKRALIKLATLHRDCTGLDQTGEVDEATDLLDGDHDKDDY